MTGMTEGGRVTPLELFFDLVFVYALTQVTQLMADDLTGRGALRGLLVIALLWWCWCCYAWLGNTVRADEGLVRIVLSAVMAVMFIVSVTIPEAFDDLPRGLSGPVVFAACYLLVRTLHLVLYYNAARGNPGLRRQLLRAAVPMSAGTAMLFLAALLPQALFDDPREINAARTALWVLALALDYGGIMLLGAEGWEVFSAAHWAERHGLIIIIALGESIVSIGVGVAFLPISWPIIVASVLGIAIAAALWWAYFDVLALGVERALHRLRGTARASLAIHAYTYLHLPLVAGIIFTSLGMKKVMEYVGDTDHHSLSDPLKGVALYALYGGVMAYFLGEVGIKRRALGTVSWIRLGAVVLLGVLIPVVAHIPALAAFAILAVVCVTVVAVETRVWADDRRELREAVVAEQTGHGADHPAGPDGARADPHAERGGARAEH
jgi:low temperature requirement protein LtrA